MPLSFKSELDDSPFQKSLNRMQSGATGAASKIGSAFAAIGPAMAGVLSVGAAVNFGKSILDMAGDLQDTSDALNISTDALQGLQGAFSQSGTRAEQFRQGLGKLTENQQDAIAGNEKLLNSFSKLGIGFQDVANDAPDELILKIADGFKNAEDKGAAFAAVVDLLGKGGKSMASGLSQGREELEKLSSQLKGWSKKEIQELDEVGDFFDRLGTNLYKSGGRLMMGNKEEWKSLFGLGGDDKQAGEKAGSPASEIGKRAIEDPREARAQEAARTALKKQIEEGNKLFMDGEDEKRREKKKSAEADRKLDGDLAQARKAELQKQIEDGNKLFMDGEDKKREAKKDALTNDMRDAKDNAQFARQHLSDADDDLLKFNQQSGNDRRDDNRAFNRSKRALSRKERMVNGSAVDARSGARRLLAERNEAQKKVELSDASVKKLVDAINGVIVKP